MTVPACLIAEFANIDLKNPNSGGAKREQADVIQLGLEGGAARGPPEHPQLLRWGGEGALLSQQGQCHRILARNAVASFGSDHREHLRDASALSISSSFH
jgi:hypothetical protein